MHVSLMHGVRNPARPLAGGFPPWSVMPHRPLSLKLSAAILALAASLLAVPAAAQGGGKRKAPDTPQEGERAPKRQRTGATLTFREPPAQVSQGRTVYFRVDDPDRTHPALAWTLVEGQLGGELQPDGTFTASEELKGEVAFIIGYGNSLELKNSSPSATMLLSIRHQAADDWDHILLEPGQTATYPCQDFVYQALHETLLKDPVSGRWQSDLVPFGLKVRGLLPFVGHEGATPDHQDGQGGAARFHTPCGLAWLEEGKGARSLVVADLDDHVLRRVTEDGKVTTLAGEPGTMGDLEASPGARFAMPTFLESLGTRGVAVADSGNNAIRLVDASGRVTTLAGNGRAGFADGQGEQASFSHPLGLAADGEGNLYVADSGNQVIRKLDAQGRVTTLAGTGESGAHDGPGLEATFSDLKGLACHDGLLYVADGSLIRTVQLAQDHAVRTLTLARDADQLQDPWAIAFAQVNGAMVPFVTDRTKNRVYFLLSIARRPGGEFTALACCGGRTGVRYGWLHDGVFGPETPKFASLQMPLGLLSTGSEGLFVASGRVVARIAHWGVLGGLFQVPESLRLALVRSAGTASSRFRATSASSPAPLNRPWHCRPGPTSWTALSRMRKPAAT